jgi:hypothetical protein
MCDQRADALGRAWEEFNHLYVVWVVSLSVIAVIRFRTMLGFVRPRIFGSLAGSMREMGRTLGVMKSIRDARPQ